MSPLWVVTSYYNPAGYRRRFNNFQAFINNLNAPLLVVELAVPGKHQLDSRCCARLLQLTGESSIWQKERLLNIGIAALPSHVKYVAWIDCDVAFENTNWPEQAISHLENHGGLLQLFESVIHCPEEYHPRRDDSLALLEKENLYREVSGVSVVVRGNYIFQGNIFTRELHAQEKVKTLSLAESPGHAWAARISDLSNSGIYDGNIIGGGDSIVFHSAAGTLNALLEKRIYSNHHEAHIRKWKERAESAGLLEKIDFLKGDLLHFWHGNFLNRFYRQRHQILFDADYDPEVDIKMSDNLTWKWTNPQSNLALQVRNYFLSRKEDGS